MKLSSRERSRRYYGREISAARWSARYERSATVAELVADLAVLRAISASRERRRSLYRVLMGLAAVFGVLIVPLAGSPAVPAAIGAVPALILIAIVRALTAPYPAGRIELASSVLRRLDVAATAEVKLGLDLRPTVKAAFKVDGSALGQRYRIGWLELDAGTFAWKRFEECDHEDVIKWDEASRRRMRARSWTYAFEDQLRLPHGKMPVDVRTTVPMDVQLLAMDATSLTMKANVANTAVEALLTRTGALRSVAGDDVSASVWPVTATAIGVIALLFSIPFTQAAGDHYGWTKLDLDKPFMARMGAPEAVILGAIALVLWSIALWGLVLVRRRRVSERGPGGRIGARESGRPRS